MKKYFFLGLKYLYVNDLLQTIIQFVSPVIVYLSP